LKTNRQFSIKTLVSHAVFLHATSNTCGADLPIFIAKLARFGQNCAAGIAGRGGLGTSHTRCTELEAENCCGAAYVWAFGAAFVATA
jgi:hypothetical protein